MIWWGRYLTLSKTFCNTTIAKKWAIYHFLRWPGDKAVIKNGLAAFGNASHVSGKRLEIAAYPHFLDILFQPHSEYLDKFRSLMTFRDDVFKTATRLFDEMEHKHECPVQIKASSTKYQVPSTKSRCRTMISVHLRMGDYPAHLYKQYGVTDFSRTNYLQRAVEYLSKKYQVRYFESCRVGLVAVTIVY